MKLLRSALRDCVTIKRKTEDWKNKRRTCIQEKTKHKHGAKYPARGGIVDAGNDFILTHKKSFTAFVSCIAAAMQQNVSTKEIDADLPMYYFSLWKICSVNFFLRQDGRTILAKSIMPPPY